MKTILNRLPTLIFVAFICLATSFADDSNESPQDLDTIYIKHQNVTGIYQARVGHIKSINQEYVLFDTDSGSELLTHDAVIRISLSSIGNEMQSRASAWNKNTRNLVVSNIQNLPFPGPLLASLFSKLPLWLCNFLWVSMLVGLLLWVLFLAYARIYNTLMVSREADRMNRLKVSLEILKMRSDSLNDPNVSADEKNTLMALQIHVPVFAQHVAASQNKADPAVPADTKQTPLKFLLRMWRPDEIHEIFTAAWSIIFKRGKNYARLRFGLRLLLYISAFSIIAGISYAFWAISITSTDVGIGGKACLYALSLMFTYLVVGRIIRLWLLFSTFRTAMKKSLKVPSPVLVEPAK